MINQRSTTHHRSEGRTRPFPLLHLGLGLLLLATTETRAQETCTSATVIINPGTFPGDTTNAIDDYDTGQFGCTLANAAGPDHVFSFTPASTGRYDLTLRPLSADYDASIWVSTNCPAMEANCQAGADERGAPIPERIELLELSAGTTYYIVVDGFEDDPSISLPYGPYELDLAASTVPDDCATARAVPILPWLTRGDTTVGADTLTPPPGCPLPAQTGADLVYRIDPLYPAQLSVHLHPAGWDASLYAITGCGTASETCVDGSDSAGSSGEETVSVALTPGVPVWIVADSLTGTGGPFDIEIVVGEDCAEAVPVSTFPFTAQGDTRAALDDIALSSSACTGFRSPRAKR